MSNQKGEYKLYIFGEGTRRWRLQGHYDLEKANSQARYFESLSYKVQIRHERKVVYQTKPGAKSS